MYPGLSIFLAVLRIAAGVALIGPGLHKLGWFAHPALEGTLNQWLAHATNPVTTKYLQFMIPHASVLARVVAVGELGLTMPPHHRHLVALENTPTVHNVIVCTLCSCTAVTIIGLPPDWYKDLDYRARAVRQSRTVLREMGLDLPPEIEIRVWDTTADTRYMVLPVRPPETIGWPEERLVDIVTKESMIGVARLGVRS